MAEDDPTEDTLREELAGQRDLNASLIEALRAVLVQPESEEARAEAEDLLATVEA